MRPAPLVLALLLTAACSAIVPSGPPTQPNEREWNLLMADYQWIQTLRNAQAVPPANATRKQQIEILLDNHRKIAQIYTTFIDKMAEYHERTSDPRAGALLAKEKILVGDEFMNVLSRYDSAIAKYREALLYDPENAYAKQRIALAEQRRYISMNAFVTVKSGMKEDDVKRAVGLPREDWIKQVVQNSRVYSVWIYPKSDGGASAIYFDNGVVYHTNWNAAAPPAK